VSAARRTPLDQDVRARAASRLDACYLLQAGAGTGKTTVLLDRVKEILKTNVPLDRIAVITFTEKAAGELKLRLRRSMEEMIGAQQPESGWAEHLQRSLEALDRATVCTIHAFAASLLRERPVEANVDPRFGVTDELAGAMLLEETWQRWIETQLSGSAPALSRALRLGITLDQVRRLAMGIVEHRDVAPSAAPPRGEREVETARDAVLKQIDALSRLAASCSEASDEGLRQIAALAGAAPLLRAAAGDRLLLRLEALPLSRTAGSRKSWRVPEDLVEAKRIFAELKQRVDVVSRRERTVAAHDLAHWIRDGFLHAYRAAKESRRVLDFTDLLIICRNMLRDSRAARAAFQNRFDCLLVDEFQDTDPLQSEILFLLASDDPQTSDWRLARPRPGKLFVVGDPKQSIYRFRRADIELYEEARSLIQAARGVADQGLTQNFRTVPSVVAWINDVFEKLIQPQAGQRFQPGYERIAADREEPPGDYSRVLLLTPPDPARLAVEAASVVRAAEAGCVVALVRKMVADRWPVLDRQTGQTRPARHADVALLFRSSTALQQYEDALRDQGVPYRITGGKRYYLRAEMRALQAVLWAIDCPNDPLAVVSALRCPFFGFSDEELLTCKAGGGDWVYTKEGAGHGTPFERAFDLLARLHAARNRIPVAATMETLFEATGALALFYLKPDGDQRAANLLKAIDLARAHEAAGGATFGSFVRWLSAMAAEEREEGEAPLIEEAESETAVEEGDAVRISTVHKAKGLEFPIVILCDPAGARKKTPPNCVVERSVEGGGAAKLEFSAGALPCRLESAGYAQALERETARLEAESLRLFYVAATRARDHLVIPAFGGRNASGIFKTLRDLGYLPPAGAAPAPHRGARVLDAGTLDRPVGAVEPFRISAGEAVPSDPGLIVEKAGWRKALELAQRAPAMGRELRTASGAETLPETRPGAARPQAAAARRRARALGVAVHGVLERIDLATGRDIGLRSEEEASRAGHPDLSTEVRALVQKALAGEIVKEARLAPRCLRELPFAAAGDSFLTEGRIDLAFESGGALTIVDFKTDDVATETEIDARVAAYEPQALIYARALSQVTGLSVARVVFFFIRPGVERTLPVDEGFLARGRRLLETGTMATGTAAI